MTSEQKALKLAGRYARLRHRMHQCKQTTGKLFDLCEAPRYHDDMPLGSGCIASLADGLLYGPEGESNWGELTATFCRPCLLGLKVSRHRKRTLSKRLNAVLGAIKRLGAKH